MIHLAIDFDLGVLRMCDWSGGRVSKLGSTLMEKMQATIKSRHPSIGY